MLKFYAIIGDITQIKTDAIVNSASHKYHGRKSIANAVNYAAGPEMELELLSYKECQIGNAQITSGYALPAKYVIHAYGPSYSKEYAKEAKSLLTAVYYSILNEASKFDDIKNIAIPAISCGAKGYPLEEAVNIAVTTIKSWRNKENYKSADECFESITFVVSDNLIKEVYENAINNIDNKINRLEQSKTMGAIIGDYIGSRFEGHNLKSKNFELFHDRCRMTDDSMMTMAVFDALINSKQNSKDLSESAIQSMQKIGSLYPYRGYGGGFKKWLKMKDPQPYNSLGNGAAMRVSGCGWMGKSIKQVKQLAEEVTAISHNHPDAIKGAEATAVAVFLARTAHSKEEIKTYIQEKYYDMNFTLAEIREDYHFDVSCSGTVPPALEAFFESENFEDTIRNAISIGGDSDTIAAIAGAVAGAYYGVPDNFVQQIQLDSFLKSIIEKFDKSVSKRKSYQQKMEKEKAKEEQEKLTIYLENIRKNENIEIIDYILKIHKIYKRKCGRCQNEMCMGCYILMENGIIQNLADVLENHLRCYKNAKRDFIEAQKGKMSEEEINWQINNLLRFSRKQWNKKG